MVLRARWTLAGEPAEDGAEEDEEEEEEEDRVVLLLGPQTLILALPDAEDGDERDEEEGEALLPALPVRRDTTQHYIIYAFSRRFYPKRLTVHSGYTFHFCQYVFSGNRTHNLLRC